MIDGVQPTTLIKNITNPIENDSPKNRDTFPKIFRAISTRIDKCAPLATTICTNPTIFKFSFKSFGNPVRIPSKYDKPKFTSGSGIKALILSAKKFRIKIIASCPARLLSLIDTPLRKIILKIAQTTTPIHTPTTTHDK